MPRLCRCGAIVEGKCPKCDKPKKSPHGVRKWTQLSIRKRTVDPLCEVCLAEDRIEPATEVHHLLSVNEHPHLMYEWTNLQSICQKCHDRIEGQRVRYNKASIDGGK